MRSLVKTIIVKVTVFILCFIEIPYFLLKNVGIFKNKIIYIFWERSFGHTVTGIDYASRLFYPNRISLVYIPHPRSNEYLPLCYEHNVDSFLFKSIFLPYSHIGGRIRYNIFFVILCIINGLIKKFHIIERSNVYKTVSIASDNLLLGDENVGKLKKCIDLTGYYRLLKENIGKKAKLPRLLDEQCKKIIVEKYSDIFNKPFVVLLLREKGRNSKGFEHYVRCSGPQENYILAVKHLVENGFNVVGSGETNNSIFNSLNGYYSFKDIEIDDKLLNIFLLMNCKLFIGQHSGPYILSSSCNIHVLLCDVMPHWEGTFNSKDIILFKNLVEKETGKRLSLVDIYLRNQDIAYGYNFNKKKIAVEPNSAEEILEAVKETLNIMNNIDYLTTADKILIEKFRKLPLPNMRLFYDGNRVPINILREQKGELLSI